MTHHIGMSGSRAGLTSAQVFSFGVFLGEIVRDDHRSIVLHHGDCIGADEDVAHLMNHVGIKVIVHPPGDKRQRAFTDRLPNVSEVRPEKAFLARNHDIVDESERLVAFPSDDEESQPRSGTWATVRYARRKGRPVTVIWPTGRRERE